MSFTLDFPDRWAKTFHFWVWFPAPVTEKALTNIGVSKKPEKASWDFNNAVRKCESCFSIPFLPRNVPVSRHNITCIMLVFRVFQGHPGRNILQEKGVPFYLLLPFAWLGPNTQEIGIKNELCLGADHWRYGVPGRVGGWIQLHNFAYSLYLAFSTLPDVW